MVENTRNALVAEAYQDRTHYWNSYSLYNAAPEWENIGVISPYLIGIDQSIERECDTSSSIHIAERLSVMTCDA